MKKKLKVVPTLGDLLDSLMTIKNYYYSDFDETNVLLDKYLNDLRFRREKNLSIDEQQVENDVKEFWKQLILKFVDGLLNKIIKRKTKGGEFVEIKIDLEETKKNLPYDNLDVKTLVSYYEKDLKKYYRVIKEKIQNEKALEELNEKNLENIEEITKRSRNKGRIEGFLISLVTGLITGYALYKLGYM